VGRPAHGCVAYVDISDIPGWIVAQARVSFRAVDGGEARKVGCAPDRKLWPPYVTPPSARCAFAAATNIAAANRHQACEPTDHWHYSHFLTTLPGPSHSPQWTVLSSRVEEIQRS
jgi:hypothetical protein